jgi:hypothetical protein
MDQLRGESDPTVAAGATPALRHAPKHQLGLGKLVALTPRTPFPDPARELLPGLVPESGIEQAPDFILAARAGNYVKVGICNRKRMHQS